MWVQVAAGLGRGHAVEIGDEPITIGSGPGCALVDGEPVDGSAVLEGHEEVRLGESAVVRLTAEEPSRHDVPEDPEMAEALAPADERAPRRRLRDLGRSARRATALAALALLVAAGAGVFA
jgi:hypothetical protein